MTRLTLIFALSVSSFCVFAETPQIVNPPRPSKQFKWLLVVKYQWLRYEGPSHYRTDYVYTNNFQIDKKAILDKMGFNVSGPTYYCFDENNFMECIEFDSAYSISLVKLNRWDENPNFILFDPFAVYFLRAKMPELKEYPYYSNLVDRKVEGAEEQKIIKIKGPKKAKVVFTK